MIIEEITVTAFQQHTRIVGCEQTKQAICIDPGDEAERIIEVLQRRGLVLQAIALTHAHLDHVGAVAALKKLQTAAKINLHKGDEFMYRALPEQPSWIGIPRSQWAALGFVFETPPAVDHYWTDGERYTVGKLEFAVRHCPGHTRSEEHTSELQSRFGISYAVFSLKKQTDGRWTSQPRIGRAHVCTPVRSGHI